MLEFAWFCATIWAGAAIWLFAQLQDTKRELAWRDEILNAQFESEVRELLENE